MAGVSPRVSVSLPPEVADTVVRLSAVQGRSQSAIIGELVTEMEPSLRKLADLGEALRDMSEAQKASLRSAMAAADEVVAGPMEKALESVAVIHEEVAGLVAAADEFRPPLGNTGVR